MLGLVFAALLPAPVSATASAADGPIAPTNDTFQGAIPLSPAYSAPAIVSILPDSATGGWEGATNTEDSGPGVPTPPTCLGSPGYHSMWYSLHVVEAGVLTAAFRSADNNLFKPLVSIIDVSSNVAVEVACALAGNALLPNSDVSASSYVPAGDYLIRIASATNPATDVGGLPVLQLTELLRDVTPPVIRVASSKTVGVGKPFTFNATASTDGGSGVLVSSAIWTFRVSGTDHPFSSANSPTPELATYTWKTPGFHLVTLTLADNGGNKSTYSFNVFVHSFIPPTVSMRVVVPKPGARQVRILLTHDQPVRVRLVVLQAGAILRTIPSKGITGSGRTTSITIRLLRKVARTGYVFVSGTASDLSTNPNTVALKTCSVLPGKGGGACA
jgi:hypothetical protein